MQPVSLGVGIFPTEPPRRILSLVMLAESLGYDTAYIGDSQMIWREAFTILGAAATATKRIKLAPGVTNTVTRDPAVLAAASHTMTELTGGRWILGVGTGDSSLETLGKRTSTLASLTESMQIIRALLAGETTRHPETGAEIRLTYADGSATAPLYVAVSGPKIHRLAGKLADGAIVLVGTAPGPLAASRRALEAGAREAGHELTRDNFKVVCWVPCSIQEDGRAARAAVKAHVSRVLKRQLPFDYAAEVMAVAEKIREQYEYYEHMVPGTLHGELVPDELVEQFAIAGTPDEAREQLARLAATRLVDEIAIIPHAHNPEDRDRIMRIVAEARPS